MKIVKREKIEIFFKFEKVWEINEDEKILKKVGVEKSWNRKKGNDK